MQKEYYTLEELASHLGAQLQGDSQCKIFSVAPLEQAQTGQISFLVNSRYQLIASSRYEKFLATTKASAVLLSSQYASDCPSYKLIMDDPYQGYLKLAALFKRHANPKAGIHPSAVIGEHCNIAQTASIGANCVIGDHVSIGENTYIGSGTVIKDNVVIGKNGYLACNISVYEDVKIGDDVIIHAGAIIGSEGFGLVRDSEGWKKIPHLGSVIIGKKVEIGANTTIDRGSLSNTILEDGVKLDNLIQIGHGVVIGENTVIAGCVGIGGSTRIGKNCMVGGACGISDNLEICDNAIFTGMAQVVKSIHKPGVYSSGTGIQPQKNWQRTVARLHNLDDMARKIRKMEQDNNE